MLIENSVDKNYCRFSSTEFFLKREYIGVQRATDKVMWKHAFFLIFILKIVGALDTCKSLIKLPIPSGDLNHVMYEYFFSDDVLDDDFRGVEQGDLWVRGKRASIYFGDRKPEIILCSEKVFPVVLERVELYYLEDQKILRVQAENNRQVFNSLSSRGDIVLRNCILTEVNHLTV